MNSPSASTQRAPSASYSRPLAMVLPPSLRPTHALVEHWREHAVGHVVPRALVGGSVPEAEPPPVVLDPPLLIGYDGQRVAQPPHRVAVVADAGVADHGAEGALRGPGAQACGEGLD